MATADRRHHRQYLRPWLEETLNEGRIPGVEWLNIEDKLFKIPWKRNSDQTRPEDFEIFRAWARHTGREEEDEGKTTVYTKWKTRLRCAIHKAPDIREEKDMHRVDPSEEDPFKVYRFLNIPVAPECFSPSQSHSPASSCEDSQDSQFIGQACAVAEIPAVVNQFDETQPMPASDSDDMGKFPSDLEMCSADLIRGTRNLSISNALNSMGELEDMSVSPNYRLPHSQQHMAPMTCTAVPPTAMAAPLTAGVAHPGMPPPAVASVPSDPCMSMSSGLSATGFAEGACYHKGGHRLTVQVYYSGRRVATHDVVKQCRVSRADPNLPPALLSQAYGPQDIPKFEMPSSPIVSTPGTEKFIEALLKNMQHGFVVNYEESGDVYVTRYCKVGVFVEFPNCVEIKKLERGERTKVFDQSLFEMYLKQSLSGTAKRPSHEVILVIGQKPKNDRSAYLMYVTLSSGKSASQLVTLDQPHSASIGPALEMSVSDEYDNLCKHTTNTGCESMDTE